MTTFARWTTTNNRRTRQLRQHLGQRPRRMRLAVIFLKSCTQQRHQRRRNPPRFCTSYGREEDTDDVISDDDGSLHTDCDITITADSYAKQLEPYRPEFQPGWSFARATSTLRRSIDKTTSDRLDSSVDDFFGIMEEDPLPPLPSPPSALCMPPVYTEYDPPSGRWQIFSGTKTFWIEGNCVASHDNTFRSAPLNLRLHTSALSQTDTDSGNSIPSAISSPGALRECLPGESLRRFSMPSHLKMWQPKEPRPKRRYLDKWNVITPQPAHIRDLDFTFATIAGKGPIVTI
ncbi:hypothetical protein CF319_g6577 [Tilletia indica]|nr:hypothetical protein CF319_g6577 [Tilletia indica]